MSKVDDTSRTMSIGEVTEFLREHGKINEKGDERALPQAGYYDLMAKHFALTRPVIQQVVDANKLLSNGMVELGTRDLIARIETAKERGEDPKALDQTVHVSSPFGALSATIFGTRSIPNPADGSRTDRHGAVRFRVRTNTWVDANIADSARDSITKMLAD